ncbi:hypothetical protein GCM10010191_18510 [Actinomadura vinacea]|uniref:Uncharacterized protein n=1 Tax=Actinomadura vinacea TaxID=115336 RepID=A0ABN3IQQ1_9ACTN
MREFAALVRPGKRLGAVWRGDLPAIVAYAVVVSGMNFACFSAIGHIPLGVATAIELLGPLDVAWVLPALAGLALLTVPGETAGIGLAFAAAAAAHGYAGSRCAPANCALR